MKIGSKVVLMRDKRYGIIGRGRYADAKILTLESRDHQADETFIFVSDGETITATKKQYGSLQFEKGWHAVYIDKDLPYEDLALAANLARYIESSRKAMVIHIGDHAGDYTLGTALVHDYKENAHFSHPDIAVDMPIILDRIEAAPGSLIACEIHGITENEHGFISYQARDIMELTSTIQLETIEGYNWPVSMLMGQSELSEKTLCHRLAKIDDEVLYYVSNGDPIVITSQGLRAHQSGDLSADAWGWGNGDPDGFYVARNLAWAGSGEDVELEADTETVDDGEVARILHDHGFGSTELIHHDIDRNTVMRIAAHLGDEESVHAHYAELDADSDD